LVYCAGHRRFISAAARLAAARRCGGARGRCSVSTRRADALRSTVPGSARMQPIGSRRVGPAARGTQELGVPCQL
jgi:hypothetical protein